MGGRDDNRGNDLDKWIEAQRAEIIKLRDELLGQRNNPEKDIGNRRENASSTVRSPFERFKNFIDSNFTTLSEGLRNFPSNISELKERMQQEREARREEEKLIWATWTGSNDSPDFIRMQIERSTCEERAASRDAAFQLLRQAYEKNKNVSSHKILDLYRDNEWKFGGLDKFANPMLSFGGACYYKPETVDNLPSTARWGWPASSPQWLSGDWFKRSPYSPIRLEVYPGLPDEGRKWRAAFEDLLSVALDKPMVSEEKIGIRTPHGKPQSTYYGPGLEWMLSLQCRGILPPQLPSLYKAVSLFDGFDKVKRPRIAPFMHDIAQILDAKSATMYPMVKRDLEALIDEVSIKSGPETEAAPLLRSWGVAPWRVPETEQDLYDEMPPFAPEQDYASKLPSVDEYAEMREELYDALSESDVDEAASILSDYFKEYNRVGELIGDVLDEISDNMDTWGEYLIQESLRRSDIPDAEQKRLNSGFGWSWEDLMDKYGPFDDDEIAEDEKVEEEVETVKPMPPNTSTQPRRPDVLAQLTTTQTTRSPDGTVTTKVVLKQRFADGTEEERETVHTSREPPSASNEKKSQITEQEEKKEKKKAGWFWS